MSKSLSIRQEEKINGLHGLVGTMSDITNNLPTEQCQLLKTQIGELRKLSDALSIIASNLNIEA